MRGCKVKCCLAAHTEVQNSLEDITLWQQKAGPWKNTHNFPPQFCAKSWKRTMDGTVLFQTAGLFALPWLIAGYLPLPGAG